MIVIGVDVHKHELTAVAVDELGRELSSWSGPVEDGLLSWAGSLEGGRRWALEDCRHVSRGLEGCCWKRASRSCACHRGRPHRSDGAGRVGGTSDALDALAIARAALREPRLDHPRAGEERLRELKLLLDHRDDLLAERRRAQQRLRWHLHELDPSLAVPPAALDRGLWLARLGRWWPAASRRPRCGSPLSCPSAAVPPRARSSHSNVSWRRGQRRSPRGCSSSLVAAR
jgi:transposase